MSLAHLKQRVARLKTEWTPPPRVPTLPPMTALELWQQAMGTAPDAWQKIVLKSDDPRICLNCCRQAGKSQTTAIKAIATALNEPKSLILSDLMATTLLLPACRQQFRQMRGSLLSRTASCQGSGSVPMACSQRSTALMGGQVGTTGGGVHRAFRRAIRCCNCTRLMRGDVRCEERAVRSLSLGVRCRRAP
jgi:hypothetical protein